MMLDGSQQVAIFVFVRLSDRGHLHPKTRITIAMPVLRDRYFAKYRGSGTTNDLIMFFIGALLRFDNHIRTLFEQRSADAANHPSIRQQLP